MFGVVLGADREPFLLCVGDVDLRSQLQEASAAAERSGRGGRGAWLALVVEGDAVEPGALARVVAVAEDNPSAALIYGDAVVRRTDGSLDPLHRPAWSPELLRAQMYIAGLWLLRLDVADAIVAEADDEPLTGLHDLALRAGERAESVVSVPLLLAELVERPGRPDCSDAGAVGRHLGRVGVPARAARLGEGGLGEGGLSERELGDGTVGFEPKLNSRPLVSIVVPTGGTVRRVRGHDLELVSNAVRSVVERSTYAEIEIVVVIDHKSPDELGERLASIDPRVVVVRDTRPFNFAATANLAVEHSTGSVVVLLNDDTEVVTPDWVERLVALTTPDDVGAVGVRLLYGDGRLQHGGVVARNGSADHLHHGYPGDAVGHHGLIASTANLLAVTGAVLAVRRDHWDAVGGMNERLPLNYNDVDLCLRLSSRGWRTVFDGQTVLTHLETSSRPQGSETWEHDVVRDEWGDVLSDDPFDNPNLRVTGVSQHPRPAAVTRLRGARGEAPDLVYVSRSAGLPKGRDMPGGDVVSA